MRYSDNVKVGDLLWVGSYCPLYYVKELSPKSEIELTAIPLPQGEPVIITKSKADWASCVEVLSSKGIGMVYRSDIFRKWEEAAVR